MKVFNYLNILDTFTQVFYKTEFNSMKLQDFPNYVTILILHYNYNLKYVGLVKKCLVRELLSNFSIKFIIIL